MKKFRDIGRENLIESKRTGKMTNRTSSDSWLEHDKTKTRKMGWWWWQRKGRELIKNGPGAHWQRKRLSSGSEMRVMASRGSMEVAAVLMTMTRVIGGSDICRCRV
jgi:hypothetical protein